MPSAIYKIEHQINLKKVIRMSGYCFWTYKRFIQFTTNENILDRSHLMSVVHFHLISSDWELLEGGNGRHTYIQFYYFRRYFKWMPVFE